MIKKYICIFLAALLLPAVNTAAFEYADSYGKVIAYKPEAIQINDMVCYGDSDTQDFSLTSEVTLSGKNAADDKSQAFLYFRCSDTSNGYALKINDYRSTISVYKIEGGVHTWLLSAIKLAENDEKLKIKLTAYGNTFKLYVASKGMSYFQSPSAVFSDNTFKNGKIAFVKPYVYSDMTVSAMLFQELTGVAEKQLSKPDEQLTFVSKNLFSDWTDCKTSPYAGAIRFLASRKLISGIFTNMFCPDNPIKINEFLKIYTGVLGLQTAENSSDWSRPYIDAAIEHGLISENTFDDYKRPITASEAHTICSAFPDEPGKYVSRGKACFIFAGFLDSFYTGITDKIIVSPPEYDRAFSNPLKGFRGSPGDEFVTLVHHSIPWNNIEENASDGADKITAYCDNLWKDYPSLNIKAVPRVILQFNNNLYWPSDMNQNDYSSNEFISRMRALIQKLGAAWDNDPRVAYVQMGIIGNWGEMQSPYPTHLVRKALDKEFSAAFKNKKVQANFMLINELPTGFGYYWDSFAHPANVGVIGACQRSGWQSYPFGGETAFDWGSPLGTSPDDALLNHSERYLDVIRYSHATYLGWISKYTQDNAEVRSKAEQLQKALGYRLVITDAAYTKSPVQGSAATVKLHVINTGSAPVYYNWNVRIALLDSKTHKPLWYTDTDCGINTWLPDDDYSEELYYTADISFTVPQLPDGNYIIAASVAEPGADAPSLRFANSSYYNGGYTPLGVFSISAASENPYITDGFDDLQADRLSY